VPPPAPPKSPGAAVLVSRPPLTDTADALPQPPPLHPASLGPPLPAAPLSPAVPQANEPPHVKKKKASLHEMLPPSPGYV
jgi:hypothetical protein